jgi:serine/threonine protein kinase
VQQSGQWRRRYILGRELGAGQTAVVFEAFATAAEDSEPLPALPSESGPVPAASTGSLGRRVALKRLNGKGTSMFRQEVRALLQVGVHPHVLRLLECFQNGEDDVLILEYCEGGDVYELYAQNNGVSMEETFVAQLVRQIIMALEHLMRRGVEHRDVKPENLLLYGKPDKSGTPHVKLADFGWASIVSPNSGPAPVPPDGVGSLWYAPPELNPSVEGVNLRDQAAPMGRSDMWSVGVITYLLLVGHSPFNLALRITEPAAREAEVLRLAALGLVNSNARAWSHLSSEARSFIGALIQPSANARMSPEEAYSHKFIARRNPGGADDSLRAPLPAFPSAADKMLVWQRLDGFQRLGWLAISRAVAEPELLEGLVFRHLIFGHGMGSSPTSYVEKLAMELAGTAIPTWFNANTAWADVIRLGFRYLDIDVDGLLGREDLMRHVVGDDADKMSSLWLGRWSSTAQAAKGAALGPTSGISFQEFRYALQATLALKPQMEDQQRAALTNGKAPGAAPVLPAAAATKGIEESVEEIALRSRLAAIDEVCEAYMETEGFREMTW